MRLSATIAFAVLALASPHVHASELVYPMTGKCTAGFDAPTASGAKHRAIDIQRKPGDPIVAARAGTVAFAGYSASYGGSVIVIAHDRGYSTRYAFVQVSVTVGQSVA